MLAPETVSSQSPLVFQDAALAEFHWASPEYITLAVSVNWPIVALTVAGTLEFAYGGV